MTGSRILIGFTAILFAFIAVKAYQQKQASESEFLPQITTFELSLDDPSPPELKSENLTSHPSPQDNFPQTDRIALLFNKGEPKLPFVQTIRYSSKTDWKRGGPAWLVDYANHFETSRHFIARSLNGKPDYLTQKIANNDYFNVLRQDRDLSFYLAVDLSRLRMWFYAHDGVNDEHTLLKTYPIGLGRPNEQKASGFLTPLGQYGLGDRIATYQPGRMGVFKGKKTEMIRVFGTRWIPFDKEIANNTEPARGFGLHGVPWDSNEATGQLQEQIDSLGKYESDGCIRLSTEDIEELFAIIITKPTTVEIVRDIQEANIPGKEARL